MTRTVSLCIAAVLAGVVLGSNATAGAADPAPNLVPLAPSDLRLAPPDDAVDPSDPRIGLRFTSTIANFGGVPFEFIGVPESDTTGRAFQCVGFVSRVCVEREERGQLAFHSGHGHFHVEAFARYAIVPITDAGTPDLEQTLVEAPKVSFCLMDSSRQREPEPGRPDLAFYTTCTLAFQGISAGWADVYPYDLEGQFLPTDTLADGTYALVVSADPLEQFWQSTNLDDVAWRVFTLSQNGTVIKSEER